MNQVACNNSLLFHSYGGQKPEVKVNRVMLPLKGLREEYFLPRFDSLWLVALLGIFWV